MDDNFHLSVSDNPTDNPTLCNFRWSAPILVHDQDEEVQMVGQRCTMRKHHLGDHISWARVTAANKGGE